MPIDIEEFHQDLFQEVVGLADVDGAYLEDSFFEVLTGHLVDAGELDTADRAYYTAPRGIRIDGYAFDPASTAGVLNLIISDFSQDEEIGTLTETQMNAVFKRIENFLVRCLDPAFRDSLEETTPAFGVADLVAARWASISAIRLFLITNKRLSQRVDGRAAEKFKGVPVTYNVWDLNRLYLYVTSGHGREDIVVDLSDCGGPLTALPAHLDGAGYEAYLVVFPAEQLAAIYDRWGARLLEQNVRVFLQARGKVNKKIRNTLDNEPEMFFAYNNGLTATAESIETRSSPAGLQITKLQNFQIVNGGQTTASIHVASRKKDADLSRVFVQMKLSIIEPEKAVEVVPLISESANTQNKVNAADFFANHPFHVRMEDFSRRLYAPSQDGTFKQTKWFYERARGQYQDERAKRTVAERKKFDAEYPKRQMFDKTALAKYLMVWEGYPHLVSQGAQKNFAAFALFIGPRWDKNPDVFNETYYRHTIAKAIVFRQVEKLVSDASWYDGGYRANVVAYAISKLAHDVGNLGVTVDFTDVWQRQAMSQSLAKAFGVVAEAVHASIIDTPPGTRNVTEWAKQQACWHRVQNLDVDWPEGWLEAMATAETLKQEQKDAAKDQRVLNGIQAQMIVVDAGCGFWKDVIKWGQRKKLLSDTEVSILEVCASVPKKVPSEKQCIRALEALKRLHDEGCTLGKDLI